jgi:N-acetylmuramoyl-L-alanine amidase
MKAFIVGHTSRDKGAFSPHLNVSEWDFYCSIIDQLKGDVYFHDANIRSYDQRCRDTAARINKKNYEVVIALHFNSAAATAHGTECLYISNSGLEYAKKFNKEVSKMGLRNRGEKRLINTSRGYSEIYYPKAPAILIEPFFGSNIDDCKKINKTRLIQILNEL